MTGNDYLGSLNAEFEKQNPDIQIIISTVTGGSRSARPIANDVKNGNAADIMFVSAGYFTEDETIRYFENLSDNSVIESYQAAALNRLAVNDEIYFLPGPSEINCMLYNQTMFESYGWEVPKTFDEFVALCVQIREDTNGAVQPWNELKLCGKTTGDYNNLFLKFKVVDTAAIGESVNTNSRSYKVSGIELLVEGDRNATEYAVSSTYVFTGYAKGLGPDATAESTLTCNSQSLETITLDVKHTFYRTLTSSKGAGYQNQLDTVYFAVPKRFFENYGTLQRIKAEWYEYKTNDIVVTSNSDFYNAASPYLGIKMATEYNKEVGYSLGQDAGDWGGGFHGARWGWNLGTGYLHPACERLTYLFKVNDISKTNHLPINFAIICSYSF